MTGDRLGTTRGFSTAASLLVVFVGLFLALGSLYTVTANTAGRVGDAREDQRDHQDDVASTAIHVASAEWDASARTFVVRVNNTGETTLSVPATDTVVVGRYVAVGDYERVTVAGEPSDLWRPGEQLVLEDDDTVAAPDRVKVVTETGVAATAEVVDV